MRAAAAVPAGTSAFREEFRAGIPSWYRGWGHFAFTSSVSLAVIGVALWRVESPSAAELATVPLAFLFANFVEYRGHKGPMHHPVRFLRLLHTRHTLQHHRFFTHQAMACESSRDFKIMLFPSVLLLFFIGLHAIPVGALLFVLAGPNVGYLFAATAIGYFLTYEWLHFAYHLQEGSRVRRLPGLERLRQHHLRHHDPALMQHWNFNITFPIFDRVLGTSWRGRHRPSM